MEIHAGSFGGERWNAEHTTSVGAAAGRPPDDGRIVGGIDVSITGLHERLAAAAGQRTYRHLSELTKTNQETVRRYMTGQTPSVEYLTAFCEGLGINGEWLLTGAGPMRRADLRAHSLRLAEPSELLSAMADSVERLIERVERLEVFVQTLETRVRGRAVPLGKRPEAPAGSPSGGVEVKNPSPTALGPGGNHESGQTRRDDPPAPLGGPDRHLGIQLPQPQRPRAHDR